MNTHDLGIRGWVAFAIGLLGAAATHTATAQQATEPPGTGAPAAASAPAPARAGVTPSADAGASATPGRSGAPAVSAPPGPSGTPTASAPPGPSATAKSAQAASGEGRRSAPTARSGAQDEAGEPRAGAAAGTSATDRVQLDATTVTGNQELPKVMYVVPWKKSDVGDLSGRPLNSLLDEILQPVDRDVFRREVTYYQAVKADAPNNDPAPPRQGEK